MNDIRDVIESLRAEIEAAKRDIEGKEAALRLLESRYGASQPTAHATGTASPQNAPGHGHDDVFDVSSLDIQDGSGRRTFNDELRDVLRRFGAQEFGIAHAEAALKKMGIEVAGKTPRSRISASLSKLNEEGFLMKTFKGGGNVPHRYKVRAAMTLDEITLAERHLNEQAHVEESQDVVTNDGL